MNINVQADKLTDALSLFTTIINARPHLPILGCVLLTAKNDNLVLSAGNLRTFASVILDVDVQETGTVVVNYQKLRSIMSTLANIEVGIKQDGQAVLINYGAGECKLLGNNPEEYPPMPVLLEDDGDNIAVQSLIADLDKVVFAAAKDSTRYTLECIYCDDDVFVGCDTKILAVNSTNTVLSGALLPLEYISTLKRMFQGDEEITVGSVDGYVYAKNGSKVLLSATVEGIYPDYNKIVPESARYIVTVKREELLGSVVRTSLLASERTYRVKIGIHTNELRISSESDLGNAEDSIVVLYGDLPMAIFFDSRLLKSVLQNIDSEDIDLLFDDPTSPVVIVPSDAPVDKYKCVIMPMKGE